MIDNPQTGFIPMILKPEPRQTTNDKIKSTPEARCQDSCRKPQDGWNSDRRSNNEDNPSEIWLLSTFTTEMSVRSPYNQVVLAKQWLWVRNRWHHNRGGAAECRQIEQPDAWFEGGLNG
ncbi:hypothetical protein [Bifidobacterium sp. ESL0745]|uniref:hypothetical protein n=1 Tax=Bifidobacterium sp. ESL0745 TaxID=2983226 RepID=UPI0023F6C854|nr:hypothetical protein [Bifidobacterium sp. ESL0745]MDF7665998.1 hypothetical protein [Bifidobacterium sp. ESL0745]